MEGNKFKKLVFFIPFAILAIFYIILPLVSIVLESFQSSGNVFAGVDNYKEVITNKYYFTGIKNSLRISLLSSFIGLVLSFIGAYVIYSSTGKLRSGFINILNMTSNFQGIQLAFAFMIILGNSGVFVLFGRELGFEALSTFNVYSLNGILLTFIYFQIPLGTLLLYPSFGAIQKEYQEAAQLFNTGPFRFWIYIGLPILLPSLIGTFSILFSNALAAYATPYALTGNNFPLMPIQISSMFTGDIVQQPGMGSALSVIMILMMILVNIIAQFTLVKRNRRVENEK